MTRAIALRGWGAIPAGMGCTTVGKGGNGLYHGGRDTCNSTVGMGGDTHDTGCTTAGMVGRTGCPARRSPRAALRHPVTPPPGGPRPRGSRTQRGPRGTHGPSHSPVFPPRLGEAPQRPRGPDQPLAGQLDPQTPFSGPKTANGPPPRPHLPPAGNESRQPRPFPFPRDSPIHLHPRRELPSASPVRAGGLRRPGGGPRAWWQEAGAMGKRWNFPISHGGGLGSRAGPWSCGGGQNATGHCRGAHRVP